MNNKDLLDISKITNSPSISGGGYVISAEQLNPDIEGSLANKINTLDNMIHDTKLLLSTDDWNTFINPGVYKVVKPSGNIEPFAGPNSPLSLYPWGILLVLTSYDAIVHFYINHNIPCGLQFRCAYTKDSWRDWVTII